MYVLSAALLCSFGRTLLFTWKDAGSNSTSRHKAAWVTREHSCSYVQRKRQGHAQEAQHWVSAHCNPFDYHDYASLLVHQ